MALSQNAEYTTIFQNCTCDGKTTKKSSRSRLSKARASGQLDSADEQITGENYSKEQGKNNQEDQDDNSRNGEAAVLYLTTELGPDETII